VRSTETCSVTGKQDVYVPSEHGDGGFVEGKVKHKVGKIVFETCDPRKHSRIQCSVGVNRMMGVKEFFYRFARFIR
jgi:hypothetical protein